MRKKGLIKIVCRLGNFLFRICLPAMLLTIFAINLSATLYFDDYGDNPKYENYFNVTTPLLYNGAGITAVKMNNDNNIYNYFPTVFVADRGINELIWNYSDNSGTQILSSFNNSNNGNNFSSPNAVCAYSNGDVFVADSANNRIVKLNLSNTPGYSDNNLQFTTSSTGSGSIKILSPLQVCTDYNENIYLTSTQFPQVEIIEFDSNLNILNVIRKNVLSNPCGIAAATYYVDPSKNWIYVSDSYRSLLKIDTTVSGGNIVLNKSLYTDYALDLPGNAIFGAMDCDVFGNLYVVDPVNNQLYKFNPDLQFIESFSGSPGMTFSGLNSVTVDKIYNFNGTQGLEASRAFLV